MAGNAAIDNGRMEALNAARMKPPKADDFEHLKNGHADAYSRSNTENYLQRLQNDHNVSPQTRPRKLNTEKSATISDVRVGRNNFHIPNRSYSHSTIQARENNGTNEDSELSHADRLDAARQQGNHQKNNLTRQNINLAKDAVSLATPMGAFSLLKQIRFLSDFPFAAAIGMSILKDLLDLIFIGSLPGLGTVISICLGIFIFMMTLLAGAGGKRKFANSIMKKGGVVIAGTLISFIPGINFFPEATATASAVYFMTLSERKHEQKSQEEDTQENDGDEEDDEYREAA